MAENSIEKKKKVDIFDETFFDRNFTEETNIKKCI